MGLLRHVRDPLYRNGVALVLNSALSSALGFVFWMVAARRFHADALGVGAAVISAATLAALVGKAGFDAAVIRYAPSASPRGLRRIAVRATLATLGLTGLVAGAVLVVAALGVPALSPLLEPAFAAGFVLLALATSGAWVFDALAIAERRASLVLARNVAFNGVKILVPLFLAFEWGGRAVPLAWGVGLAASLAVALACVPSLLAAHTPQGERPSRSALGYSMRNYALNLSEFLPGLILPILVLDQLGAEQNARFFLAWTMATVLFLASKAIAQSAFAELVRDADARPALRKGFALSALLLGPATIVLYVGAPQLLSLFGEGYAQGADLLRLLALSVPFLVISNLYLAKLKATDAGWELTLLPLAVLGALLAAFPYALRAFGVPGAGFAWLVVQTIVGAYATARLFATIRRNSHATSRTALRRHPHQG